MKTFKKSKPSRDTRLKCRFCPKILVGPQGRAAHERHTHPGAQVAEIKKIKRKAPEVQEFASEVEVVTVEAVKGLDIGSGQVAVALLQGPQEVSDDALVDLDQAIGKLKRNIEIDSKEAERLSALQRGIESNQARLKVLETAREEFVKS